MEKKTVKKTKKTVKTKKVWGAPTMGTELGWCFKYILYAKESEAVKPSYEMQATWDEALSALVAMGED